MSGEIPKAVHYSYAELNFQMEESERAGRNLVWDDDEGCYLEEEWMYDFTERKKQ